MKVLRLGARLPPDRCFTFEVVSEYVCTYVGDSQSLPVGAFELNIVQGASRIHCRITPARSVFEKNLNTD